MSTCIIRFALTHPKYPNQSYAYMSLRLKHEEHVQGQIEFLCGLNKKGSEKIIIDKIALITS